MCSTYGQGQRQLGGQFGTCPVPGALGLWVLPGWCWLPAAEPTLQAWSAAPRTLRSGSKGRGHLGRTPRGGQGRDRAATPAGEPAPGARAAQGVSIPGCVFTGGFFGQITFWLLRQKYKV